MDRQERTDEAIKLDIVDQLHWDGRLDVSDVTVTVSDRAVTLAGQVPTYRAKRAAVDDAWQVKGIETVRDELTVSLAADIGMPEDTEVRATIVEMLGWDSDLTSATISVTVNDGWVDLKGTVENYWQKLHAEYEVQNIRGVVGVTNELGVVPTENTDDRLIAREIVSALDRNAHVEVDHISVKVEDGEVTLTGTIPSLQAKKAADNSASYTRGVKEIDNRLIMRN